MKLKKRAMAAVSVVAMAGVTFGLSATASASPPTGCGAQFTLMTIQQGIALIDKDAPLDLDEVETIIQEKVDFIVDDDLVCVRAFKPNQGRNMKTGDPNDAIFVQFLDNTAGPKK